MKESDKNKVGMKAAKSAIIIILLSLSSKVLGFTRETLIAAKFGSGMETDAFFVALTATSIVTSLVSSAITTTFIPILAEIESREGKKGKLSHTNNMLNIVLVATLVLVVATYFLAPILVKLNGWGFSGEQYGLAVKLTKIGAPMVLFSGGLGVLTGFLHSEDRHAATAALGYPMNLVYIAFLLLGASRFGIKGLMVAAIVAVASQLILLTIDARKTGLKYKFVFDLKDRYIRKVLNLSGPVLIGVAISDANAMIDKTLASTLSEGSISALNYASKLNGLILGVFIAAITTVIYPILSRESNNRNIKGVKNILGYGTDLILLITVPATVGIMILAEPIVQVAFQRGKFDAVATMMTSQALLYYSVGMVGMAINPLVVRVYYSLQDTKTPTINSAIAVSINIVLNLLLIKPMGHGGLALATSISISASTLWLYFRLRKKLGNLGLKSHLSTWFKIGFSSLIMGVGAYFSHNLLAGFLEGSFILEATSLGLSALVGVIIYGILTYMLGVDIVRDMVDKIINRALSFLKGKKN